MTWGFSYKEDRRLIELARDKKKSAEEIAHLRAGHRTRSAERAVRSGISLREEQAKVEPDRTPKGCACVYVVR